MSNRTNIAVTPVVITKRAGLASADVLVSKYTCYAMPGGTLAELRTILLEDEIMEVEDKFYVAGTTLGKSAERVMKWDSENVAEVCMCRLLTVITTVLMIWVRMVVSQS